MPKILITGGAGFIGYHLDQKLRPNHQVSLIDKLSSSNTASIKRAEFLPTLKIDSIHEPFITNQKVKPDVVVHLAAETGISGSLTFPDRYFRTNVEGTFNVLEECRKNGVKYLIYASSSSVYSSGQTVTSENSKTSTQLSFYGTSKKMAEVMIENYCQQFGITAIGLRFFTVYGSWTRPDMAAYKFMTAIEKNQKIKLYNNGKVFRDFTHVSDVVNAIDLLINQIKELPEGTHELFNIGLGKPVSIKYYAEKIAENLKRELTYDSPALPTNELESTNSDSSKLGQFINYFPSKSIEDGVKEMVDWFNLVRYD
jgi:UDP-glucuronate 4-epimerase